MKIEDDFFEYDEHEQYVEFVNNMGTYITLSAEDFTDLNFSRKDSIKRHDVDESFAVLELPAFGAPVQYKKAQLVEVAQKLGVMMKKVVTKYDKLILRMDVTIDGMETVKAVPVELTGIRSYKVTPIEGTIKGNHAKNLSFIVNIKSKNNGQIMVVSFESPIVFANNLEYPISIS